MDRSGSISMTPKHTGCVLCSTKSMGPENFVTTVIWQKIHARNNSAQHFSADHDFIHVYAKDARERRPNRLSRTAKSDADFWNPDDDQRGPWRRSDPTASKPYADGHYSVTGPYGDVFSPRPGRPWAVSRETFAALASDDRLWWGKTGRTFPFRKRFASELGDLVPNTVWLHEDVGNNREAKQELSALFGKDSFSTPKPEGLLARVISVGSNPGDLVLDCFAGSGTTAAVAHKLGPRWATIELSPDKRREVRLRATSSSSTRWAARVDHVPRPAPLLRQRPDPRRLQREAGPGRASATSPPRSPSMSTATSGPARRTGSATPSAASSAPTNCGARKAELTPRIEPRPQRAAGGPSERSSSLRPR